MPSNMTRADALAVLDRFGTPATSILATTRRGRARSLVANKSDLRARLASTGGSNLAVVGRGTLSVSVGIAADQVVSAASTPILRDDFTTTTGVL